jgi:hypothetical protein
MDIDKIINRDWKLESQKESRINPKRIYKILVSRPCFLDKIAKSSLKSIDNAQHLQP